MSGVPLEAHLQMIHSTITRLAGQSTTVKGWSVTLTAALLGFGAASTPIVALLAVYVVLAFAVLDAYYLSRERAFRRLYRRAVAGEVQHWELAAEPPRFRQVAVALRSPAILLLYGTSLVTTAGVATYLYFG